MRIVRVKCEWTTYHEIEVDDDLPEFEKSDLEGLTDASGEDVVCDGTAELSDWEISDPGPS